MTGQSSGFEYTPEEAARIKRLGIFVSMRLVALAGVLAATLFASLAFRIKFPTLAMYAVCVFITISNTVLFFQTNNLKK